MTWRPPWPRSGTNEDFALGKHDLVKAATVTQISSLNAKNWATADTMDQIIPKMMMSLMQGANFTATVDNVNTQPAGRAQHRLEEQGAPHD